MADPTFDPAQPFEAHDTGAVPQFDDSKPFETHTPSAEEDKGGIGRNLRAGFTEGLTGIPDMLLAGPNKMYEAVKSVLPKSEVPEGTYIGTPYGSVFHGQTNDNPFADDAIGHSLNKGLGMIGLNPEDVTADSGAEHVARLAGTGATALLAPESAGPRLAEEGAAMLGSKLASRVTSRAANSPITTAVRKGVTGVSAGTAGGLGAEAVPDDDPILKQAVTVLASIAGGAAAEAPALAKGVIPAVKRWTRPLTTAGQDQIAADTIRSRATNPAMLADDLDNAKPEIVRGSAPTLYQQTGDTGLGSLERETATKNPAPFIQRRADQNAARHAALTSIQEGGDPEAVGTFLRGQFRSFDDQTQQHIDALTANAQQQTEALGGHGVPEEHGAALRGALQDAENSARARERSLWKAVDPDRNLVLGTQPTVAAAKEIAGSLSPSAKPMAGEEKAIFDVAANYNPQMPFADLSDLRSRTSTAMREELMTNGATPAYARLSRLRGAIQNNISEAAAGQATQDAKAVAAGTLAPEQTLMGKLNGWVDDFYGNRTQSLAASGKGAAADTGPGATSFTGADGTGFPAEIGPTSLEGNQSVPKGPEPFDEAAAGRLAEATDATKNRSQTFGQGPVKQTLAKAGMQDAYRLPEARVPEKFFHAGPTSFQDIQRLRSTVGDEAALPIIKDYAAASLRRAAERPDGTLDPRKVAAWQQKYGNALRAFPELSDQFSTASRASEGIADAAAARRDIIADRNSSALGKVVGAQNAEDVTKTIGGILGRKNGAQAMQDLATATAANPEARQGLRQAVADHIASKLISNTEAGTSGLNLFKADAFQSFVKQNRAALSTVFSPQEVETLDRIAADLKRANRSISGSKLPGGSNTAQDIHGIVANDPNATVLDRAISEATGAGVGAALGHGHGGLLGWMGAKVANAFRTAGFKKVDDLLAEAMLNPDLARDLLRRAPARHDSGQSIALASRLRRIALAAAATRLGPDRKPNYATGGRIRLAA